MTYADGRAWRRPVAGLLAADVISTAGTEITAVALPWFVLISTGSPAQMGTVLAAEFAGMAVLGLAGGRLSAGLGPRTTMLTADLVRAGLVAAVPALYWAGRLNLAVIVVIGFTVGAFFPAYSSSQRLALAALVDHDELRLTRVGGLFGSINEFASFAGPALGGVLVALAGPVPVLLVDAASYLCAFALIATMVPDTGTGERPAARRVRDGLGYLWRERGLRREVAGVGIAQVGWTAMVASLPVLALQRGGGASAAGWLLAAYGGGSVLGGLISARAGTAGMRGIGGPRAASLAMCGIAASAWLLLLPVPWQVAALAVAANGVCAGLFFPRFFASVTVATPEPVRAVVLTTVMVAISAPGPVGFIGAGVLVQHAGAAEAGLVLAAAAASAGAAVWSAHRDHWSYARNRRGDNVRDDEEGAAQRA